MNDGNTPSSANHGISFRTFFATGVLAVSAFEGFLSRVGALVFDERAFRGSGVDANVATERLLSSVRAQMGS